MTARRTSVLVVEDEILISNLIAEVMDESSFAVHAVADGGQALRYLESGADVNILFTDINLLGPMDGSMLARAARAQRPDADRLLFGALLAVRTGAASATFDFRNEALQLRCIVPPVGAADREYDALRLAYDLAGKFIKPRGTSTR
jgi:CheY-like chemotaxis protein